MEGIKSRIYLNTKESESPKLILNNKGEYLNNPNDITNRFHIIFCSVAPNIQSNIKLNFKSLHHYLNKHKGIIPNISLH